ncbi:MAG: aspartate-semialdehyde dehydrogenase, partial [Planctomycetota bacterium]|nr:aspartate-semialdehyde dehydrogenase [Planctomycetota bacterium]
MYDHLALVGATGAVGTIVRQLLVERAFPYKSIRFIASARSAGSKIQFDGTEHTVVELGPDSFDGIDLVIASTPDDIAAQLVPWAKQAGAVVV